MGEVLPFHKNISEYTYIEDTQGNFDACNAIIRIDTNIPFFRDKLDELADLWGNLTPIDLFRELLSDYPIGVNFRATIEYEIEKEVWEATWNGSDMGDTGYRLDRIFSQHYNPPV